VKLLIPVPICVSSWFQVFLNAYTALKRRLADSCVSDMCHPTASEDTDRLSADWCLPKYHIVDT